MSEKRLRLPLTEAQRELLAGLQREVPQEKVVRYEWGSPAGRAFVSEVRRRQLTGVPLPWIAEALGIPYHALQGAIGYWERKQHRRRKAHPAPPSSSGAP